MTSKETTPSEVAGQPRGGIVLLGSLNMDIVVKLPQIARPGETVLAGPAQFLPGGKGANQAVTAARLGGQVTMLGCVGDDTFGTALRENLRISGVAQEHVRVVPDQRSGMAFVSVDPQGENAIVVSPGANHRVSVDYLREKEEVIAGAALVVTQMETPVAALADVVSTSHRHRVPVLLNLAPYTALPEDLVRSCDYIVVNRVEASCLTGVPISDRSAARAALRATAARHLRNVVITLGGDGCVAVSQDQQLIDMDAYRVTPVDSTGAGDAFVGALATALAGGEEFEAAIRYAAAVGAVACTHPGAQGGERLAHEVEQLMNAQQPAVRSHPLQPADQARAGS